MNLMLTVQPLLSSSCGDIMEKVVQLGFPSGYFSNLEQLLGRLALFKELGCPIVELHLDDMERVELILQHLSKVTAALASFDLVSLHASNERFCFDSSGRTPEILKKLDEIVSLIRPWIVVVHPDLIDDPAVLTERTWPIGLENMDWRKLTGRFADELDYWFKQLPEAAMVLDVNHVYTNDRTMALAHTLWDRFHDRIRHIHISGFIDGQNPHVPFYSSDCDVIIESLPTRDLPMILELEIGMSKLSPADIKQEYEYVLAKLRS